MGEDIKNNASKYSSLQNGFRTGFICACVLALGIFGTCGSQQPPIPVPPPTCTLAVTVTTLDTGYNMTQGIPYQISNTVKTKPMICLCSDNVVRKCQ